MNSTHEEAISVIERLRKLGAVHVSVDGISCTFAREYVEPTPEAPQEGYTVNLAKTWAEGREPEVDPIDVAKAELLRQFELVKP